MICSRYCPAKTLAFAAVVVFVVFGIKATILLIRSRSRLASARRSDAHRARGRRLSSPHPIHSHLLSEPLPQSIPGRVYFCRRRSVGSTHRARSI
ncbi:hypothetical protein BDV98DRAFT_561789 [Pterulicium gracile]|uniref:Uncharacterized protein n=1 Tax=Pterulicium gracile TaxID=1884261 RepID=A0A5C3QV89_9AGAR|nr:hypothetical protein BDV98DRAFT_561789 [Pterula gracilis]